MTGNTMPEFAPLDEGLLRRRLELPRGRTRLIIDTDAHNEIDDQYALAWAFLSQDAFDIVGILAEPYGKINRRQPTLAAYDALKANDPDRLSAQEQEYLEVARRMLANDINPHELQFVTPAEGMELSYQEILKVDEMMGAGFADRSFRGSETYLASYDEPVPSDSAQFIIEQAMSQSPDDEPLYIAAIGCVTNIASAILMEPRIRERIVVSWTSSYPSAWDGSNFPSYNLVQDPLSSQLLFACGVPLIYLPGYYVGEVLGISLPEMERWVAPQGRIGAYLYELYTNNPIHTLRGIRTDDLMGRSWVIWDLINFAWQMRPDWVPSRLRPAPILDDELVFRRSENPYPMREAYGLNRDAVYRDFFRKLAAHAGNTLT